MTAPITRIRAPRTIRTGHDVLLALGAKLQHEGLLVGFTRDLTVHDKAACVAAGAEGPSEILWCVRMDGTHIVTREGFAAASLHAQLSTVEAVRSHVNGDWPEARVYLWSRRDHGTSIEPSRLTTEDGIERVTDRWLREYENGRVNRAAGL